MKKTRLLAALLAGVMALSLTACGSTEEDTTAPAGEGYLGRTGEHGRRAEL